MMGKYINQDTVTYLPLMEKVAPRSPKLTCPTAQSPEEETQVLVSCPDVREGPVGPGR